MALWSSISSLPQAHQQHPFCTGSRGQDSAGHSIPTPGLAVPWRQHFSGSWARPWVDTAMEVNLLAS